MKQRQTFLEGIKKRLLERRYRLTQKVESHAAVDTEKQAKDAGDQALTISLEKLESSLQMSEVDEIKRIDDALVRIERGEYGVCVDCESHISDQRLDCAPYSARCIVCQEAFEG